MSFRSRLTLFFVAIVVVPMIVVALLVARISEDSREGKADARLATGLQAGGVVYDRALDAAADRLRPFAGRAGVALALARMDRRPLERVARGQVDADDGPVAVRFFDRAGSLLAGAGPEQAIATARAPVRLTGRGVVGEIEVAMLAPDELVDEVAELTGAEAAVVSGEATLAATSELAAEPLPAAPVGTTDDTAHSQRAASLELDGAPPDTRLVLAVDKEPGFAASEPIVIAVLVAFVAFATLLILAVARTLQGQIASMLDAARRIGGGDFSHEVPVEGNDEMAGLAREFNKMTARLKAQMGQLRRQREELDESVRRIGEAFASGLDRGSLLEIVIEAAAAACEAEFGRIELRGHERPEAVAGGEPDESMAEALRAAAREAIELRGLGSAESGGARAIAHPMTSASDRSIVLGTMAVGRRDRGFNGAEGEVLRYLIGQATVSVENIGLHERVAEQAVTDELTGLANNRHFREWMENETARIGRFGGELSLVLLDIDDFKQVNDSYGHLQGDAVLEEIGRILRLESRGIDEPARYGGEEFVLALPETPKEGAIEVAERVRERIAATRIRGVDRNPDLSITASLGVATMPADGAAAQVLLAVADQALYEAKRTGKNRVIAAGAP